jgi:hypothetical protein
MPKAKYWPIKSSVFLEKSSDSGQIQRRFWVAIPSKMVVKTARFD